MRYYQFFLLCALAAGTTGCAITSGLQTFDLPSEGVYQTELGTPVNVLKLTQESLPALQPAQVNIQHSTFNKIMLIYLARHIKIIN